MTANCSTPLGTTRMTTDRSTLNSIGHRRAAAAVDIRPPLWLWCVGLALMTGLSACQPQAPSASSVTPLRLALNWLPDAQHGGFYAADVQGYFAADELQVEILPGGPAAPTVQNLAMRRVDFAIANADQVLMARAQGMPVVAVFAAMQTSPRCILVHRSAGITRFDELHDLTLAVGTGQAFAAFLRQRLPLNQVTVVPYTGSLAPFLADPRFAQQAYVFSEPFVARREGADPVTLMVSQLGFDPYASCLLTHEALIQESPERVGQVVRAIQRGWIDYLQNPSPVNRRIHEVNPQMDLASLEFGANELRQLCLPDGLTADQLGTMTVERWNLLNQQLIELDLVSQTSDASAAFTNQFLTPPNQAADAP